MYYFISISLNVASQQVINFRVTIVRPITYKCHYFRPHSYSSQVGMDCFTAPLSPLTFSLSVMKLSEVYATSCLIPQAFYSIRLATDNMSNLEIDRCAGKIQSLVRMVQISRGFWLTVIHPGQESNPSVHTAYGQNDDVAKRPRFNNCVVVITWMQLEYTKTDALVGYRLINGGYSRIFITPNVIFQKCCEQMRNFSLRSLFSIVSRFQVAIQCVSRM